LALKLLSFYPGAMATKGHCPEVDFKPFILFYFILFLAFLFKIERLKIK
jgi:hypothetical protein